MSAADLRVDVPRLEPSDVLVAQLASLAVTGAATPATPVTAPWWQRWLPRAAAAAASVTLVAGGAVALGQAWHAEEVPGPHPAVSPDGQLPTVRPTPRLAPAPETDATHAVPPSESGSHSDEHPRVAGSGTGGDGQTAGGEPAGGRPVGTGDAQDAGGDPAESVDDRDESAVDPDSDDSTSKGEDSDSDGADSDDDTSGGSGSSGTTDVS